MLCTSNNTDAISEFFNFPQQYIGKKTVEDSAETFVYYLNNGVGMPQHFAKDYDLVFLTVENTCSTKIILVTYNTLEWMR